jgi:hypothetical protein
MQNDSNVVVSGWWHDNELAVCPDCGNKQLTPPSPSMGEMRVCLTCGIIGEPDSS